MVRLECEPPPRNAERRTLELAGHTCARAALTLVRRGSGVAAQSPTLGMSTRALAAQSPTLEMSTRALYDSMLRRAASAATLYYATLSPPLARAILDSLPPTNTLFAQGVSGL